MKGAPRARTEERGLPKSTLQPSFLPGERRGENGKIQVAKLGWRVEGIVGIVGLICGRNMSRCRYLCPIRIGCGTVLASWRHCSQGVADLRSESWKKELG